MMGLGLLVLGLIVSPVFATYGIDISSGVSGGDFACLKSNGYQFSVTRAWQSNGVADPNACGNIVAAHQNGFAYCDVYLFPCYSCGNPTGQVSSMVSALSAKGCTANGGTQGVYNYGMIWLDIEGPGTYWSSSTANNQNFFQPTSESMP